MCFTKAKSNDNEAVKSKMQKDLFTEPSEGDVRASVPSSHPYGLICPLAAPWIRASIIDVPVFAGMTSAQSKQEI